jgi:ethanolamine utilization protein EutA
VGNLLQEEFDINSDIISVDQIHLHDFDYIDIGQVVEKVEVVPIVVKSLVLGKQAEEVLRDRGLKRSYFH